MKSREETEERKYEKKKTDKYSKLENVNMKTRKCKD